MNACVVKQAGSVDNLRGLLSRTGTAETFEKLPDYVFKRMKRVRDTE